MLDASKARLHCVVEDIGAKTLHYIYGFGKGWNHTIKVERVIDPVFGVLYPRLGSQRSLSARICVENLAKRWSRRPARRRPKA